MIDVTATKRTVRECLADFEHNEGGELKIDQIRVRYFSFTLGELKKLRSDALARANKDDIGEDDFPWLSNMLADKIESLPDLSIKKGKFEITVKNLDSLSAINLQKIEAAINADLTPPTQPGS